MKLIHAALGKVAGSRKPPVLQALLAICHAYTQQHEEARAILATLPPLAQMDPITFNTVTLVYRALDDGTHTHLARQ